MSLDPPPVLPKPPIRGLDVFLGLVALAVCHVMAVIVSAGIGFFFLGALQLLYVVPIVFAARRSARRGIATGMAIGASLTFLLNAGCWGMLLLK